MDIDSRTISIITALRTDNNLDVVLINVHTRHQQMTKMKNKELFYTIPTKKHFVN